MAKQRLPALGRRRLAMATLMTLAFGLLAAMGLLASRSISAVVNADRWQIHTYLVMENLERLGGLMKQAENGERGFILTGTDAYLAPYTEAKDEVGIRLAALATLTRDNPGQEARLRQINTLIQVKMRELQSAIGVRRSDGFDAARAEMLAGHGPPLMSRIRVLVADAQAEEQVLLAQRTEAKNRDESRSLRVLTIGGAGGVLLLLLSFSVLQWELRYRARAEEALKLYSGNLEALVRVRTEALEQEVAERRKTEDMLRGAKTSAERANDSKSRFLAAASHDLRQPLQALNLYIAALEAKSRSVGNEEIFRNIEVCMSSLNALLKDLLDLSKFQAGVMVPAQRTFPVAGLFEKLASAHGPAAGGKGLRLRAVPTRLVARTDPILYERLLNNLVANAVRYTDRGAVLVGCRHRQGKAWIEVRDSGIGIPPDKTGEIFEEFVQLGNAERSREKGSGLGLAIVARTAELLGLQLSVCSQPGKGSVFSVELPLEAPLSKLL